MLTEAASLKPLSALSRSRTVVGSSDVYVRSVVVIAVDVEDLVALHTQNTARGKGS